MTETTQPRPRSRFQSFDDPSHRKGPERIEALRAALRENGLDGFVVPRADEHQSEYVPADAERLAWLTGFTGSAGTAVILTDTAALVVDGRYTLQAPEQVDTGVVTVVPLSDSTAESWVGANLKRDQVLGYDPWLHTPDGLARLERAADQGGRRGPGGAEPRRRRLGRPAEAARRTGGGSSGCALPARQPPTSSSGSARPWPRGAATPW